MRRWLLLSLAVGSLIWPALAGAKDDEPEYPIPEWSLRQVQKFLRSSPWAKRVKEVPQAIGVGADSVAPDRLTKDHPLWNEVTADVIAWAPGRPAKPGIAGGEARLPKPPGQPEIYYVRWYSARVVRDALLRGAELADRKIDPRVRQQLQRDDDLRYILALSGPGLLTLDGIRWEAFAGQVTLTTAEGLSFPLLDVRTPRDLGGIEEALFFFDRTAGAAEIPADSAGVTFRAHFGAADFQATFHPQDMTVDDRLDLDGLEEPDEGARTLRLLELALLNGAPPAFKRAITNTEFRKKAESLPPDLVVLYDARREVPGEPAPALFQSRMYEAAVRLGKALEGKTQQIRVFWFVDRVNQTQAYLYATDCVVLSRLKGQAADEFFASHMKTPQ